jgi:protein-L-isoaspartate(D-aspartate) O-methyltransferase
MDPLAKHREYFASFVLAYGGVPPPATRLWQAFASTPREHFVGTGPWKVYTPAGYIQTPSADAAFIYQDVTVSLRELGEVNNGRPTVHATSLAALDVQEGEDIVQVGAGTGYYSALLSQLVGPTGLVNAYEIEADLAARAASNLTDYQNVVVHNKSGATGPLPACDAIYVNAGATDAMPAWLDALRPGGRLLFPLVPSEGLGGMLLLTRQDEINFAAKFIYRVTFIPCIGARDDAVARDLTSAFQRGDVTRVRSFQRGTPPDATCWSAGRGWWLSVADPVAAVSG